MLKHTTLLLLAAFFRVLCWGEPFLQNNCSFTVSINTITHATCDGTNDGAIDIDVSGGTAPYAYSWSTGANTQDLTGLAPGTYTLTISDGSVCTQTLVFKVYKSCGSIGNLVWKDLNQDGRQDQGEPPFPGITINLLNEGGDVIDTKVSAADGSYEFGALNPGKYSVQAIQPDTLGYSPFNRCDELGLTVADTNSFTAPSFDSNINIPFSFFGSLQDGNTYLVSFDVLAVNNTNANLEFFAEDVVLDGFISNNSNLQTKTYTFTKTVDMDEFKFTWESTGPNPKGFFKVDNFRVGGVFASNCDSDINKFNSGKTPLINLSMGEVNNSIDIGFIDCGLSAFASVTDSIDCFGENTAAIDLVVSGGNTPYTYIWSNQADTEDLNNLPAGNYSVLISDANACTFSVLDILVTQPDELILSLDSIGNVTCNGDQDGLINISVAGGTGPYIFEWSNGASTEDLSGLSGGTFNVTVTDAKGCTKSLTDLVVIEPDQLGINTSDHADVGCFGDSTGFINLGVTGGTLPYQFSWSNGAITQNIDQLAAGDYSVLVTDSNNCIIESGIVNIIEPDTLIAAVDTVIDLACQGDASGEIRISVSGGTAPYIFDWSNGATTEDLAGLPAGTYSLRISDQNACADSILNIQITEPIALSIALDSIVDVSCAGFSDGEVNISILGGTAPFTYTWSNGSVSEDLSTVGGGIYSVSVRDSNSCVAVLNDLEIKEPVSLALTVDSVGAVNCFGEANGFINITPSGGLSPYEFLWSNDATTEDISNLIAATYSVTVTDSNGCVLTEPSIELEQPDSLFISLVSASSLSCSGDSLGSIDILVNGGTAPYEFLWSNDSTTEDLSGLKAGSYSVTVTDANGCTAQLTGISLTEPTPLSISNIQLSDASCFGESDGSINLTLNGGTLPYQLSWNNGGTTEDLTDIPAGEYILSITDANNCILISDTLEVLQPDAILITVDSINDAGCNSVQDGGVFTTVSGGTGPYSYLWSNGSTLEDLDSIPGGTYWIKVLDANGCEAERNNLIVNVPSGLAVIQDSIKDVSCYGGSDGSIDLRITGGDAPFSILWSTGATTEDIDGLPIGLYGVSIRDSSNCVVISTVEIEQPDSLILSLIGSEVGCDNTGGTIDLSVEGGTPVYDYLWSNGATTQDLDGLSAGTYIVTLTDFNGCIKIDSAVVTQDTLKPVVSLAADTLSCDIQTVTINTTVDLSNVGFEWAGPQSFTSTEQNPVVSLAGAYILTTTNLDNNCFVIDTISVAIDDTLPIITAITDTITCLDDSVVLSAQALNGESSFLWEGPNAFSSNSPNPLVGEAGEYNLTITRLDNGCFIDTTIIVGVDLEKPELTIINDTLDCINPSVDIVAQSNVQNVSYSWTGSQISEVINDTLTTSTPGQYFITVTNLDNGCSSIDSLIVLTDTISPTAVAQGGILDCDITEISLNVQTNTSSPAYSWTGPGNFSSIEQQPQVSQAGEYIVVVTNTNNGCFASDTAIVILNDTIPEATLDAGVLDCNNASQVLNLQTTLTNLEFSWTGPSGFLSNEQQPEVSLAGTYVVDVRNPINGCINTLSVNVIQDTLSPIVNAIGGQIDCSIEEIALQLSTNATNASFDWAGPNGFSSQLPSPIVDRGGFYTVTVTDLQNGCTSFAAALVDEDKVKPDAQALVDAELNCINELVTIEALPRGGFDYVWSGPEGFSSNLRVNTIANPGTYDLSVKDNSNGCEAFASVLVEQDTLSPGADAGEDKLIICGTDNAILDGGANVQEAIFSWIGPNGFTSNDRAPVVTDEGLYTLFVIGLNGCESTDKVLVQREICSRAGNRVWEDVNLNGVQDLNEPGVAGVQVSLFNTSDQLQRQTTTDEDGFYLLDDLSPGRYYLRFSDLPEGFVFTQKDQGNDDFSDSDADEFNGETDEFDLIAGQDDFSKDAGVYFPTANIGNKVWYDVNQDGFQDDSEPGVPGVSVKLFQCNGIQIAELQTDENGEYRFTQLDTLLTYFLEFSLPEGFEFTQPDQADNDQKDSDVNPSTGRTICIDIDSVTSTLDWDAGLIFDCRLEAGTLTALEVGSVCADSTELIIEAEPNGDILVSQGFSVIYLLSEGQNKVIEQIGSRPSFSVFKAGTFSIHTLVYQSNPNDPNFIDLTFIQPGISTINDLDEEIASTFVCAALDLAGAPIQINECASISGITWEDLNGDGIQDILEPRLPGIEVNIFSCDSVLIESAVTDNLGKYFFNGLTADKDYFLQFINNDPSLAFTLANQADDDIDSDVNSQGFTDCISLNPGDSILSVDAGLSNDAVCIVNAGSLIATNAEDTCLTSSKTLIATHSLEPVLSEGYAVVYILSRGDQKAVLGLSTQAEFAVNEAGTYGIHTLVYQSVPTDPDFLNLQDIENTIPTIVEISNFINERAFCASIDTAGAAFNVVDCTGIGDRVWNDLNRNGRQDDGEPGLEGIPVSLFTCDSTLVSSTKTNAQGRYLFTNISDAVDYYIRIDSIPANYVFTFKNAGTDNQRDSDVDSTGATICINLAPGESDLSLDAGVYEILEPTECEADAGSLQPIVIDDNCFRNEPIEISVSPNNDQVIPSGFSRVYVLTSGEERIIRRFSNEPQFTVASPDIYRLQTLVYNANPVDPNYLNISLMTVGQSTQTDLLDLIGLRNICYDYDTAGAEVIISECVTISGRVWEDKNEDGIQDADEPGIFGIAVDLYQCDGLQKELTVFTNVQGDYTIVGIPDEQEFFLEFGLPNGFAFTDINRGNDDTRDSDVNRDGRTSCLKPSDIEQIAHVDAGIFSNGDCPRVCDLGNWGEANVALNHAIYLFDSPADPGQSMGLDTEYQRFVWEEGAKFMKIDEITIITGVVVNKMNPNQRFAAYFKLGIENSWPEWLEKGGTYLAQPEQEPLHPTWSYYRLIGGNLIGLGELAGSELAIDPYFDDPSRAFQVGVGANYRDGNNGIAGWFRYTGWVNGRQYDSEGSINVDIEICRIDCRPEIPTYVTNFSGATLEGLGVQLEWFTVIDGTSYSIVVERADDCLNYEPLATFSNDVASTAFNEYFYLDDIILDSTQSYCYRLKVVKPDGTFELSNVVEISFDSSVEVYPNPATSELFVKSRNSQNKFYSLILSDSRGVEIKYWDIVDLYTTPFRIGLDNLVMGIYYLRIVRSDGTTEARIIQVNH